MIQHDSIKWSDVEEIVSITMSCPTQGKCIARNECDKHRCGAIDIVCQKCGQTSTKRTRLYNFSYLYIGSTNGRHFIFAPIIMRVMTNITALAKLPSEQWLYAAWIKPCLLRNVA